MIWLSNVHPTDRIVARYEPRLTRFEVSIMADRPYENAAPVFTQKAKRTARKLVLWGLLERHPEQGVYRCTEAGMWVVRRYRRMGWL